MSQKPQDSDQMKEWLGLLDDKERAAVLKTQIEEKEKTERVRLEQQGQTDRDDDVVVARGWVRGAVVAAVMCAIAASTCVGYRAVDAWQVVKTQPGTAAPAPAVSPQNPPAPPTGGK